VILTISLRIQAKDTPATMLTLLHRHIASIAPEALAELNVLQLQPAIAGASWTGHIWKTWEKCQAKGQEWHAAKLKQKWNNFYPKGK